jgi:hypothetical protein
VRNEGRPDLAESDQVFGGRLRLVVAGERPDDSQAERLRGVDDFDQVRVHLFAVCGVRMEVIRVVRERRDLESVLTE